MAQFSYQEYAAKRQAEQQNRAEQGDGNQVKVHFFNEFLKADGDSIIVRFPYRSINDIEINETHLVILPSGNRYGTRIECTGDDKCPLCAQGEKIQSRVFVKGIIYVVDKATNQVKLLNGVWDRPSAFADIELSALLQDYGDLTRYLFKIRRAGSGTATRYTIAPVLDTNVYNPEIYKADFTELDKVVPASRLSRSIAFYNNAINRTAEATSATQHESMNPTVQTADQIDANVFGNVNTTATQSTPQQTPATQQVVNTYQAPQTIYSRPQGYQQPNQPAQPAANQYVNQQPTEQTRRRNTYQF